MANLYGTIEGARGVASRTGTDMLRARLATWHGAVVVTLDDFGSWTVHTEPADPQEAAATVPAIHARGNVHTAESPTRRFPRRPNQSPARRPSADWRPYREENAG